MAHEAHHDTHHAPAEDRPTSSFRSAYWFVIILAGLFVAAVNFVSVMSHDDAEGHGGGHEATTAPARHEEKVSHDEKDLVQPATTSTPSSAEHAPADTAHAEAHH